MFQANDTIDSSTFVFGGRLVASTEDFTVFESASGRVLKLTGISRAICERSVGTDLTLSQALSETGLEPGLAQQLQDHLIGLRLFHEMGFRGLFKKYVRFRLDLPLIPIRAVSWLCQTLETHWNVISAVGFVLLLASLSFVVAQGGIPFGFPKNVSYRVCMTAIVINTFIHEMGHAYALYHCGQKPGVIGLRIMGPFVAAYTDVNGAWALPAKQRALVSIGGLAVQLVSTVIITVALFLLYGLPSGTVFFWATLFTMIYMALPMRENDGDWFIKDMMEHTTNPNKKRNLYVVRKCFAIAGLVFFLHLLFRGWRISLVHLELENPGMAWAVLPYVLKFVFLTLGTLSMLSLLGKEYRDIVGRLRSWWEARKTFRESKKHNHIDLFHSGIES